MMMLSSTPVPGAVVPEGCFAVYEAGVVAVGNRRFERRWLVLPEGLSPLSVRLDGRELLAPADIAAGISDARWETFAAPLTCTGAPALHARLELGTARYHFAVTAGAAAITVERESELAAAAVAEAAGPTGLEIDPAPEAERSAAFECCENLEAASPHLRLLEFRFADQTDRHDNLLDIREYRLGPVEPLRLRGVLWAVESPLSGEGIALLKLAPLPESRPVADPVDFEWDCRSLRLHGDRYPWAAIGYSGGRCGLTRALQEFQRELRPPRCGRDGIAISNTWGDRNRDQALNEKFMLRELEIAAGIGLDACQIDDGWQSGVTVNSSAAQQAGGGVWEGYHAVNPDFWKVHPGRFPNGLAPLTERASKLGVGIGLWFSPDSADDFANWEKDVETVCRFEREFGVEWIKIDGVKSRTRKGEANLRRFFRSAMERSGAKLTFDLDVTAEVRPGYFGMPEFGTLFVENRYSDWRRWWPYATLRNLWQLAQAIPPVRLRFECLNPERNQEKYAGDPLVPVHYPMDWIFCSVMAASPLIWCELGSLSEMCREALKKIVPVWKAYREELYSGVTLPVGPCPDGTTTSGFFTVGAGESVCHLILLRDLDSRSGHEFELPVDPREYTIRRIAGDGEFEVTGIDRLTCTLPAERSYLWLRFSRS
ncbi:alpha-galactosidase [uncultured Victivallis sp.]|uniref:alpha-galactosidase n=1 Tax=uncultured Victivallis sp. TaxID=354118 RepID=UPI002594ACB4|nr:alpha-galactosidase [uncultured Victivallis sp.]